MPQYLIIIEKAAKNYSAYSPDIPGCAATGNTMEQTVASMKEALEFHLEGEDPMPEAKGLDTYINDPSFEKNSSDYVTAIDIK